MRAAICAVDAQGEADRRAAAKKTRDVTQTQDSDGMGILIDRDDAASVDAIHTELTRQADCCKPNAAAPPRPAPVTPTPASGRAAPTS